MASISIETSTSCSAPRWAADLGGEDISKVRFTAQGGALLILRRYPRFTRTPVVDQTALPGAFEVKLDWARDNSLPSAAPDAAPAQPADGPSILEAVQKQLGLKLEKRKGPVDLLVVDHAEKTPVAN